MTATVSPFPMLGDLRQVASDRFDALGFPTTKNEDWKFTNLAPFLKTLDARPGVEGTDSLGKVSYTAYCQRCHSLDGRGSNPGGSLRGLFQKE